MQPQNEKREVCKPSNMDKTPTEGNFCDERTNKFKPNIVECCNARDMLIKEIEMPATIG
jgi:hypothetical protein